MSTERIERLRQDLAYWQHELELNERYHRQLKFGPLLGLPVAAAAAMLHRMAAALVLLTAALVFLMGMYMTIVRRFEFRANVRELMAALELAVADVEPDGVDPDMSPAPRPEAAAPRPTGAGAAGAAPL